MGCSGLNALHGLALIVESRRSGSDETIDKIRLSQVQCEEGPLFYSTLTHSTYGQWQSPTSIWSQNATSTSLPAPVDCSNHRFQIPVLRG